MKFRVGRSRAIEGLDAVREATEGIKDPKLVMYFCGVENFHKVSAELAGMFPDAVVIGSTTCMTFSGADADFDSLTVFVGEEEIECTGGVLEEVKRYPKKFSKRVEDCVSGLSGTENTICIEFTSAYLLCEELVQTTLYDILGEKGIRIAGTSAGNSGGTETFVALNGVVYTEACVFALIHNLTGKIAVVKENVFKPTRHILTATSVDVAGRIVYEYDGIPATEAMMKALRIDSEHLHEELRVHPMGRMVTPEIYITEYCDVVEDSAISYYARIYNNTKLYILEKDDSEKVFSRTRDKILREVPKPNGSVVINCVSRALLYQKEGKLSALAAGLKETLGDYALISGYGEQMDGQHSNQTMVVIVFE